MDRNPARGLLIAGDAGSLNRRPFRPDGAAVDLWRASRGSTGPGGAEFWLPLLGLFTGARLGELCQLDVADVAERDGTTVLLIREDPERPGAG